MLLMEKNYWSIIINILVQKYFGNLTTTCVLWSKEFDFELTSTFDSQVIYLQINLATISESFEKDIYDYSQREIKDNENGVFYNDEVKKLIAAIENTHCEGFLAFQDDIPIFAKIFANASVYSSWRSMNCRFLFAYSKDQKKHSYFQELLFKNHPNILVIETEYFNSSIFHVKTNKFVGPLKQKPQELLHISKFYADNFSFVPDIDLYSPQKLQNLKGREIIIGVFDYRPFVALEYQEMASQDDRSKYKPKQLIHADGTELRICHVFCQMYNCTLKYDISEKAEWGLAFANYSGYGLIKLIIEGRIHMALGSFYEVLVDYKVIDVSTFIGRSGVTCLVPRASSLITWHLPLKPFKLDLWLAVLFVLVLEKIVLFLARKIQQNISSRPHKNTRYLVNLQSVRAFLVACYMVDIILTSVYGGGLASVLTVPAFAESPDSVKRLYKSNLTWTGSSFAWIESIRSTEEHKDPIYERLVNNFIINSFDDMRDKAKTHNMGFVLETLTYGHFGGGSNFITKEALQRLKLMVDLIYSQYTVAMVSRLWPHLNKFNELILMWHSSGMSKYWEWKITAKYMNINEQLQIRQSKYNTRNMGPKKLNLTSFAGLLTLWLAGMFLSLMVFLGELMLFKWEEKKGKY